MSKIILKRVNTKDDEYRKIKESIITQFITSGNIDVNKNDILIYSEPVMYNGNEISVEFDEQILADIVFKEDEKYKNKYQREADLAIYLSNLLKSYPQNIMYDKNLWTFLNLTVLGRYVEELYLKGKIKNPEDRIKRCLFNEVSHSKIDRSGMRFLWYFGTKLSFYENEDRALTAMEYIDPVKAIFERKLSCNNMITKAFVDAIIKGGKNALLKDKELRKAVPHHIQCYAGVTNLDAFEYDELVDTILIEQNRILSIGEAI